MTKVFSPSDARRKFLIDTSSIMNPVIVDFVKGVKHQRLTDKSMPDIIILTSCLNELRKKFRDPATRTAACRGIRMIESLEAAGLVSVIGENDSDFADRDFDWIISKNKRDVAITLITQDTELARNILDKNHQRSYRGKTVKVKRLKSDGSLGDFSFTGGSK